MESREQDHVRRERDFHDARFATGDGHRRSSVFYEIAETSRARFAEWVDEVPAGSKVLELGCGPDSVAWDLWERGIEVTGIDISTNAIDRAQERAREHGIEPRHFMVGNAEELDFADSEFDVVIGSAILHHIDMSETLREVARILRPGGAGLFHEPMGRNPAINLYRWSTPSERSADEHPLTTRDLALIESSFAEVHLEFFHLLSLAALPLVKTQAFAPVGNRLERLDRRILERFPKLGTFAWVVLIKVLTDEH